MSTSFSGWLTGLLLVAVAGLSGAPFALANDADVAYGASLREAAQHLQDDNPADAIRLLTELTRSHPQRPEAFNNLAVLHARRGDLRRARELLAHAINTHPSYATTYQNLNAVLAELAARAYDQALQASSNGRTHPRLALIEQAPPVASLGSAAVIPAAPTTSTTAQASAAITAAADATPPDAAAPAPSDDATARTNAVLEAVHAWARAWSAQDVSGYLAHYDRRFKPARGLSKTQWERQRKKRLTRPSYIDVEIVEPKVRFAAPDLAVVRFKQRYRSNSLRSDVFKVLRLRKLDDRWRILEERV